MTTDQPAAAEPRPEKKNRRLRALLALAPDALPLLQAIPRLKWLKLTGCGLLDEEADALVKSRPTLRVERR